MEPIYVQGSGNYKIKAFSTKPGFYNSFVVEQTFIIEEHEYKYGLEITSTDQLGHIQEFDGDACYEINQQTFTKNEKQKHEHSTHSHLKYRGLHLIRNQTDSDSSEPE